MEGNASFGDWLRRRRKALDLTQEALAEQVGCSVGLIRKIESDERRPSRQIADLLTNVLQIPANEREKFIQVARAQLRTTRLETIPAPQMPLSEVVAFSDTTAMPSPPPLGNAKSPNRSYAFNLPTPPTPLIGRERELATIKQLLANPACRLLTIVGPGGIGKTRVALAVASAQKAQFAQGIVFVALAALTSPEFIVPAIANALDLTFAGPTEPKIQLLNTLRDKHLLLVLDNLEHLLDEVALVSDLLAESANLKLLVTSRERLNLQGEWVFDLQGLPLPPSGQGVDAEMNSAVALFLANARRVQSEFALTDQNQAAIAHICRLVEGMPLGIELAAAWVHMLSCQEIADEIARNLGFLAVARRDMPERHRSLWATFAYSWKLLHAEEQRDLHRLSVFRGGFTRVAAEQVANTTLRTLSSLLSKSLVRRLEEDRYDLHDLIRQYAAAQFQSDTESATDWQRSTATRHGDYFASRLEQWGVMLKGPRLTHALTEMTADMDNIRQAWQWLVATKRMDNLHRSTFALWRFYDISGRFQEGAMLFHQAVQALTPLAEPPSQTFPDQGSAQESRDESALAFGQLLTRTAYFLTRTYQPQTAQKLLYQSLEMLARNTQVEPAQLSITMTTRANALNELGIIEFLGGDQAKALQFIQEGIALQRNYGDDWSLANSLRALTDLYLSGEKYEQAYAHLSEMLTLLRRLGEPHSTADCLCMVGLCHYFAFGQYDKALQYLDEGLTVMRSLGDRWGVPNTLRLMSVVTLANHNPSHALELLEESIALFRETGERFGLAQALLDLGKTTFTLGDYAAAKRAAREALQLFDSTQTTMGMLYALGQIVKIRAQEGLIASAVELLMHIQSHPTTPQPMRDQLLNWRTGMALQLTPEQIATVQARVNAMSFAMVVAEILRA